MSLDHYYADFLKAREELERLHDELQKVLDKHAPGLQDKLTSAQAAYDHAEEDLKDQACSASDDEVRILADVLNDAVESLLDGDTYSALREKEKQIRSAMNDKYADMGVVLSGYVKYKVDVAALLDWCAESGVPLTSLVGMQALDVVANAKSLDRLSSAATDHEFAKAEAPLFLEPVVSATAKVSRKAAKVL